MNMWGKICGWWVEILIDLHGYEYHKRGEKNKERCYAAMVTYCQAGRLARVSFVTIYPDVLKAEHLWAGFKVGDVQVK